MSLTDEQRKIMVQLLIEKSDRNITGKFSRADGMLYSRLQTMREKADYQNVFTMSDEQGNQLIQEAMALQQRILRVIKAL